MYRVFLRFKRVAVRPKPIRSFAKCYNALSGSGLQDE